MKKFSSFIEHQVNEEQLDEKNVPTSPEKWARAKAAAKAKFAVYPSAYANGWASKKYKAMGGGWKSVGEEVEHIEEGETIVTPKKMVGEPTPGSYAYERKYGKYTAKGTLRKKPNPNKPPVAEPVKEELEESHVAIAMGKELDDEGSMAMNQLDTITRSCEMLRKEIKDPEMQLPGWVQSKLTLAADYMETVAGYMASKNEKVSEEVEQIDELKKSTVKSYANKKQAELDNVPPMPFKKPARSKSEIEKDAKGMMGALARLSGKKPTSEEVEQIEEATPAWQRKEGKDPKGGLNRKGIASYRRANPGSKLSMAVTTKPSKLKPGSKAANRRKSFCARMGGMKKRLTSAKTARDPDSRINKALRKWNC